MQLVFFIIFALNYNFLDIVHIIS